jgi:hypothetical protein
VAANFGQMAHLIKAKRYYDGLGIFLLVLLSISLILQEHVFMMSGVIYYSEMQCIE